MYMLAIKPQTMSGWLENKPGPGCIPSITKAPSKTAVVPEPGIPKLRRGTNAPGTSTIIR